MRPDHDLGINWTPGAPTGPGRWLCDVGDDPATGEPFIVALHFGDDLCARFRPWPTAERLYSYNAQSPDATWVHGIRRHAPIPDPAAIREAVARECVEALRERASTLGVLRSMTATASARALRDVADDLFARFGLDGSEPQPDPRDAEVARLREQLAIASELLREGWNHDRMDYDTQAVNQAHRVIDGGLAPRRTSLPDAPDEGGMTVADHFGGGDGDEVARLRAEVERLREAARGARAFCGRVSNALSPSARPDLGDPSPADVREQARRVASALGRILGDGDGFGDVVEAMEALAALDATGGGDAS